MININNILDIADIKKLFYVKSYNKLTNNCRSLYILKNKIHKIFISQKHSFGVSDNLLYQSFDQLNIKGQRPTNYRIEKYNLSKYIDKNKTILDIGNNVGFFDLTIASKVKSITGIEYDKSLSTIANLTKEFLNVKNVNFINGDFNKIKFQEKFDIIFSFAVHYWLKHSAEYHSNIIYNLLNENGICIIESQDINSINEADFDSKYIIDFCKNKFKILERGVIKDDNIIERSFYICQKL